MHGKITLHFFMQPLVVAVSVSGFRKFTRFQVFCREQAVLYQLPVCDQ